MGQKSTLKNLKLNSNTGYLLGCTIGLSNITLHHNQSFFIKYGAFPFVVSAQLDSIAQFEYPLLHKVQNRDGNGSYVIDTSAIVKPIDQIL